MIPRRIWLKNFLSFGDPPAVLEFGDDEPLWVLCGPNGIGKSAVFDAITYALYGEHRGGRQKAEQLIRHGANSFELELEFEFSGAAYRICRTRPRRGRTTQALQKFVDGEWQRVRSGDPAGADTAEDIRGWVEDTLGLDYNAFTNSVLLQQGRADKLFSASRDERIAVLKGIIGFEQFESLSERVHAECTGAKTKADGLADQIGHLTPVTDDELVIAESAVATTNEARRKAAEAMETAAQRVIHARQWEKLEEDRATMERHLAEADERAKHGRQIREDKERLDDLTKMVPVLDALFKVRGRITGIRERLTTAKNKLRIKELTRDIAMHQKLLVEAEAIEGLESDLSAFPPDLDMQIGKATEDEEQKNDKWGKAKEEKTKAETRLETTKKQQEQFADVAVGIACSRCGQIVSTEHAKKERERIAAEVRDLQQEFDEATKFEASARTSHADSKTHLKSLNKQKTERDSLHLQLSTKRSGLTVSAELTSGTEVRGRIAELREQRAKAEGRPVAEEADDRIDLKRLGSETKKLDGEIKTAEGAVDGLQSDLDKASGEAESTRALLSEQWQELLPSMNADSLAHLAAERNRLIAAAVDAQFQALQTDEIQRREWDTQLGRLRETIATIPEPDCITETVALRQQSDAKKNADDADRLHSEAVRIHRELAERKKKLADLTLAHREAAERHRLLKRLDDLLAQTGLQRELVRDAEEQIVRFANETLQNLDGDLTLEEDTDPDSDRAFDLRVRRAGGEPIGVAFLSGSQRFRVAVSVALAVGQFASGRARPLEAVIVDEGFGSLDRDGLRSMAVELKRLQQAHSLRRILLVSHQPEFTDQFPVGYTLAATDAGTTATAFRR